MNGWTFDERFKAWAEREAVTLVKPNNTLGVATSKDMEAAFLGGINSRNAEVQALREALTEVTEDLASELLAKYAPMQAHPDTLRRFARDMEPVYRARKLLAGGETGETE